MTMVRRVLGEVESLERVDGAAGAVQRWMRGVLPEGRVLDVLRGSWLGHPLHPALVMLPLGSWLSAGVLDLLPGEQAAARRLVLAGLLTAGPAMVAGAAELRDLDGGRRRVGFVHLVANLTAGACYAASYGYRRGGRVAAGRALAMLGLAAVGVGGTLGGHLSYAQGVGVYRWQPERRRVEQLTPAVG
jgi:hypothetical protein